MVTLQSLNSDWPANTADSGYEPSPQCGHMRFIYPAANEFNTQLVGTSTDEFGGSPKCSKTKDRVSEDVEKKGSQDGAGCSVNCLTPTGTRFAFGSDKQLKAHLSATPPIAIPIPSKPFTDVQLPKLIFVHQNHGMIQKAVTKSEREYRNNKEPFVKSIEGKDCDENSSSESEEDSDGTSTTDFKRVRTYSCPESSRPTPRRPQVPLYFTPIFQTSNAHNLKSSCITPQMTQPQFRIVSTPNNQIENRRKAVTPPECAIPPLLGQIFHARNWSTPVPMTPAATPGSSKDSRRCYLLPSTPAFASQLGKSRDTIVDLSDDGPGKPED